MDTKPAMNHDDDVDALGDMKIVIHWGKMFWPLCNLEARLRL